MSDAELRQRRLRKRIRSWIPEPHLYQLPGYGHAYRWWQRLIHSHGRCVLTRGPVMDDGSRLWWCKWCGHRVAERPRTPSDLRLLTKEVPGGT